MRSPSAFFLVDILKKSRFFSSLSFLAFWLLRGKIGLWKSLSESASFSFYSNLYLEFCFLQV